MIPGLNLESLVIWTGGWDRWCKVVELEHRALGNCPRVRMSGSEIYITERLETQTWLPW